LDPAAGGEAIAINILKFIAGEEVENLIPEGKGY
jgi:hypothetical protein